MKTKTITPSLALALGALLTASAFAQTGSTPPPSAPAQRSAADLEKLVAPIALYPDPLIATVLPASVYPLEIVQAARFVKDTNNLAKLDQQSWDANVKAVARVPEVIAKMNEDLDWTTSLGQAFLDQQADVMAAVQTMRGKAQKAGTLKTSPQQVVVVTNTIVEKTVEQKVVYVTNTIVQIQPANPQVVYVPTYNPYTIYYPPPGPPPILTFAAGIAVGAIIANNCDWHGGGIYVGGYHHGDVDVNINRNVNINNNNINVKNTQGQKWQPDQNRLRSSGAPGAAKSMESRGWSPSTGARTAATPAARPQPRAASAAAPAPRPTPVASPAAKNMGGGAHDSAFGGLGSGSQDRSSSQRGSASRGGGGGLRRR